MTILVNKENNYLPMLLYTGLFGLEVTVTDHSDSCWELGYNAGDKVAVCTAIEEFEEYAGTYPEELQNTFMKNAALALSSAINDHLDDTARLYRYDNIASARSYAGFENAFQGECVKLAQWSANCWVVADTVEAEVLAGDRAMPTVEEMIGLLPVYDPEGDS